MLLTLSNLQELIANQPAVLIYFSTNHCAPCVSLRPKVLDLLLNRYPQMKMEFIDAESNAEITGHYGVFASPTILLFFGGKETRRFSKYISVPELEKSIERYYNLIFE